MPFMGCTQTIQKFRFHETSKVKQFYVTGSVTLKVYQ